MRTYGIAQTDEKPKNQWVMSTHYAWGFYELDNPLSKLNRQIYLNMTKVFEEPTKFHDKTSSGLENRLSDPTGHENELQRTLQSHQKNQFFLLSL